MTRALDRAIYSPLIPPQGRLSLVSGASVMTSNTTGNGTVYYVPHIGNQLPIWDGSNFVMRTFSQTSQALSDTTKSPSAAALGNNYDYFGWDDGGTINVTRSPSWLAGTGGSAVLRGTGAGSTDLVWVNGVPLNANAITNGPAAQRGTYLGTVRTRAADATIDWHFGGAASGGTAGSFCVWNMYNRKDFTAQVEDQAASATVTAGAIAALGGSTNNRVNYVLGLAEDVVVARAFGQGAAGSSGFLTMGIGHDVTNAYSGLVQGHGVNLAAPVGGSARFNGDLGFHFAQACQGALTANGTLYGSGTISQFHTGMELTGRF